jgi:hypothetical protein
MAYTPEKLQDKNLAKSVIEKLIKDSATIPKCLEIFAKQIIKVSKLNNRNWSVSLHPDSVKLIIGNCTVIGLRTKGIYVSLYDSELSKNNPSIRYTFSLKDCYHFDFNPSQFIAEYQSWVQKNNRFIESTSEVHPGIAKYHTIHSTGVLAYLREATGLSIPDPEYCHV